MNTQEQNEFNRRDFIQSGSLATIMTLLGGIPLVAQTNTPASESKPAGPVIKVALIGLGTWGREILNTLLRVPQAEVVAVCDHYEAMLKRGAKLVPNAKAVADYRPLLADKSIQAVVVATGTHQHKEIVIAALQAGKHVYCEAPLAHTVADAQAIARAAREAFRQVFQPGLQWRSDPQRIFILPFIRSGKIGRFVAAQAHWRKKQSWRQASPNPEREAAINWRLDKNLSPGLAGECGIHPIDEAMWVYDRLPESISGAGSLIQWTDDKRQVPDTVQAVLEFPGGVRLTFDATIANSFDAESQTYQGSDGTVVIRESKAWLFKEADAPSFGWEVYARKESLFNDTGIVLLANASKLVKAEPVAAVPFENTPLHNALKNFAGNCAEVGTAVEDYLSVYDAADRKAFEKSITDLKLRPAATWREGLQATVVALKANEAILKGERLRFDKAWLETA